MTTTRVQAQRFTAAGAVPTNGARQPGELWTNISDFQLGTIDGSKNAQRLMAVRFFATTASYVTGDFVIQTAKIYVANGAISPGAFNPLQWTLVVDPVSGGFLPLTGGMLSGPLGVTVSNDTLFSMAPGPWNEWVETGDANHQAKVLLRAADPGAHPTVDMSAFSIEHRPTGSGVNGPQFADYGLSVSSIKHNWLGSPAQGEMDAFNVVLRQSGPDAGGVAANGSDACAYLANVVNIRGTGYVSAFEAFTGNLVSKSNQTPYKSMGIQLLPLDGVKDVATGINLQAEAGALDIGVQVQTTGGSTWSRAFQYTNNGVAKFYVDNSGGVFTSTVSDGVNILADGAPWIAFTPGVSAGSGTIANASATGRYKKLGRTVYLQVDATITTNGTGALNVVIGIPTAAAGAFTFMAAGREGARTGKMLSGLIGGSSMTVVNYDNSYPGSDGARLTLSGVYESVT